MMLKAQNNIKKPAFHLINTPQYIYRQMKSTYTPYKKLFSENPPNPPIERRGEKGGHPATRQVFNVS